MNIDIQALLGTVENGRGWNRNGTENNLHLFGLQMKMGQNENGAANIVGPMGKSFHLKCGMKSRVQTCRKGFFQNYPSINVGGR